MNKILLTVSLFILITECKAQIDSTEVDNRFWTPRYSIGVQKTPFIEVGISRLHILDKGLSFGSLCLYSALEVNLRQEPTDQKYYYGAKIGVETSWVFWMSALEIKYVGDAKSEKLLITPKVGLSVGGIMNILYGYNFPKDLTDFEGIGHHQFSIVININEKIIKYIGI